MILQGVLIRSNYICVLVAGGWEMRAYNNKLSSDESILVIKYRTEYKDCRYDPKRRSGAGRQRVIVSTVGAIYLKTKSSCWALQDSQVSTTTPFLNRSTSDS